MQTRTVHHIAYGVATIAMLFGSVAQAQLNGKTVGGQFLSPDKTTVFEDLGTAVVGPGVEFTHGFFNFDVGNSSLTITNISGDSLDVFPADFSGFHLFDVNHTFGAFSAPFVGAGTNVTEPDHSPFSPSRLTFDNDDLFVNLQSLVLQSHQQVVVGFTVAPTTVPEPSSVALLGTGLLGLIPMVRRKRR